MTGITIWRVGVDVNDECNLIHRLNASRFCGPSDAFTATPGTGFGTSATSFTSTLSGTATSTVDGTLIECFGPISSLEPENKIGDSTLQTIGKC